MNFYKSCFLYLITDFGEAHIVTLIGEFKVVLEEAGVKLDAIPEEWIEIRQRVYARTEFKEVSRPISAIKPSSFGNVIYFIQNDLSVTINYYQVASTLIITPLFFT